MHVRSPLFRNIVSGVYAPVLAKHSKHFVLADAIDIWLGRMQRNFEPMRKQVEGRCKSQLTDDTQTASTWASVHQIGYRPFAGLLGKGLPQLLH